MRLRAGADFLGTASEQGWTRDRSGGLPLLTTDLFGACERCTQQRKKRFDNQPATASGVRLDSVNRNVRRASSVRNAGGHAGDRDLRGRVDVTGRQPRRSNASRSRTRSGLFMSIS